MTNPWMKFYTSDWRSDPRLKMCSAGARGVWIEMICLMHEATPYGHLLIYGQPPNVAQLASLTGIPLAELEQYLSELEQMGVFSRTKEGVIYSRKLVRIASRSAKMRKNGKKGGNPKLSKNNDNPDLLNQTLNPPDKPQKPEARSQRDAIASQSCARFSEFWDAYPHRGGAKRNRKGCEEKYAKAIKSGVSEQEIIDGAVRAHKDQRVLDGYARDPITWINQRGWEDEIIPQISAIDGGRYGKSTSNHRDTAKSDALRDLIHDAAAMRRTSGANWS